MWRFNKLSGTDASQYRQSELERVKGYQKKKKEGGSCSDESGSERKRKLSRER